MIHILWLLLLVAALPLLPLAWAGRRKHIWWIFIVPCLAILLYTRLEISAYYKSVDVASLSAPVWQTRLPAPGMEENTNVERKVAEHFLQTIRRPLMPLDKLPSTQDWRQAVFTQLSQDFIQDKQLVMKIHPDLSERQALIFYLVARVHGSMPSYYVRGCNPVDTSVLLFATRGNCSDYAMRLMLVADLFGLATSHVSYYTPSLPGHVLVEAYDPLEDTAWLLDANFNMVMFQPKPAQRGGMLLQLFSMDKEQRMAFVSAPGNIRSMPYRLYYLDPGFEHFSGFNLTLDNINRSPDKLLTLWQNSFGQEIEQTIDFSKQANIAHYPLTYAELARLLPFGKETLPAQPMDLRALHRFYDFNFEASLETASQNNDPACQINRPINAASIECR
jgi:hypothetical protein